MIKSTCSRDEIEEILLAAKPDQVLLIQLKSKEEVLATVESHNYDQIGGNTITGIWKIVFNMGSTDGTRQIISDSIETLMLLDTGDLLNIIARQRFCMQGALSSLASIQSNLKDQYMRRDVS